MADMDTMRYQVLARKWRPHSFAEMVGQSHVQRVLINALESKRLHHAYLFTGTRGVGKTTIARILAKSLNCTESGVSAYPCGHCPSCLEVDAGRFVDLIEVDAASRTKVEETRELLENVQYAPTKGRYKVYLIDEVHMLSNSSFNALLKTLEEPPEHVKFLFATTDPEKLPATILSRCLQFNLKRLTLSEISSHLEKILQQESIAFEAPALQHIAKAADGSMRDALSLLDQAIAYGNGQLLSAEISTMLGSIEQNQVYPLLEALVAQDAGALMDAVETMAAYQPDYGQVLAELLSTLQQIALLQYIPDYQNKASPLEDDSAQALSAFAKQMTPESIQLFYQIALLGRRDLPLSPEAKGGFEMVLLRMLAFLPVAAIDNTSPQTKSIQAKPNAPAPETSATHVQQTKAPSRNSSSNNAGISSARAALGQLQQDNKPKKKTLKSLAAKSQIPQNQVKPVTKSLPETSLSSHKAQSVRLQQQQEMPESAKFWASLLTQLEVSGGSRELANHCVLLQHENQQFVLQLDKMALHNIKREQDIYNALQRHFSGSVQLQIQKKPFQRPKNNKHPLLCRQRRK